MAQRSNVNLVVTDEDEESHSSNVSEENIKGKIPRNIQSVHCLYTKDNGQLLNRSM